MVIYSSPMVIFSLKFSELSKYARSSSMPCFVRIIISMSFLFACVTGYCYADAKHYETRPGVLQELASHYESARIFALDEHVRGGYDIIWLILSAAIFVVIGAFLNDKIPFFQWSQRNVVAPEKNDAKFNVFQKLISKAPQSVDALFDKLNYSGARLDRKNYVEESLKTVGSRHDGEAAKVLKRTHPVADKELKSKVDEFLLVDQPNAFTQAIKKEVQAELDTVLHEPYGDLYICSVEQNAEYILIKNGVFSEDGKKQGGDIYFAKYPVTNKRYRNFIAWLQSVENREAEDIVSARFFELAGKIPGLNKYLGNEKTSLSLRSKYDSSRSFSEDDQPVVGVSWYAARAYCLWLSLLESNGKDSGRYRLPKSLEWEYAASGKENRDYPWPQMRGEPTAKLLNFGGNVGRTTPVASYPEGATPEGVYDMAGNVWEWTDSWADELTRSYRLARGASWDCPARRCLTSYLYYFSPSIRPNSIGFRLVCTLE
jgi:hypothetical protein